MEKTWATRRNRLDVHLKKQYNHMRLNLNAIKTFCEWFRPFEGSKKAATTRNIMVFTTHWPSLSHWLYERRSSWTRTDPEIAKNGSSFLGSQNKKPCETPIGSHSNELNIHSRNQYGGDLASTVWCVSTILMSPHFRTHTLIAVLLKAHSRIPNKHILTLTYPRSDIWYEHIHMLMHPVVMSFGVGFKTNIFVRSFVIFSHLIEFLQHSGFKSAKPCRTWCLQGSFAACKGLVRQVAAGPRLQKWVTWKVKPRELLKETGDGRQNLAIFCICLV